MDSIEEIGIKHVEFYITANTISCVLADDGAILSKERFLELLIEMGVGIHG